MNSNTLFTGPLLARCLVFSFFLAPGLCEAQVSESARSLVSPASSSDQTHRVPYKTAAERSRVPQAAEVLQGADPESEEVLATSGNIFPPPRPRPYSNVRVNQDSNPYPKTLAGIAVDPTNDQTIVVSTNDDRLGYEKTHDFFHVSSDGGLQWTDDITPYVQISTIDPDDYSPLYSGPADAQYARAIAFDSKGSALTALGSFYSVNLASALNHGRFSGGTPAIVVETPCVTFSFDSNDDNCDQTVSAQGVAVDHSGTASDGSVYVFYNINCNNTYPCGNLEGETTQMAVGLAAGPGLASFQSGVWSQSYYADISAAYEGRMVIDGQGTPYLFFLDGYEGQSYPLVFWQSKNGVVGDAPLVQFLDTGLNNPNWSYKFSSDHILDCAEHGGIAYCVFTASQVGTAIAATTPSIFLAAIDLTSGVVTYSRVNNDSFTGGKDHFNPSIAVLSDGAIYVGWFDNRRDPTNLKVDYFVGKSVDGGKTFPTQRPVNDVIFDPTLGGGTPNGALAGGKEAVIAAWSDTRDGLTKQIWSQTVRW